MKIVFPFLSSLTPPLWGGEMVWAKLLFPLPVGERVRVRGHCKSIFVLNSTSGKEVKTP
jgi:hypothetical protein